MWWNKFNLFLALLIITGNLHSQPTDCPVLGLEVNRHYLEIPAADTLGVLKGVLGFRLSPRGQGNPASQQIIFENISRDTLTIRNVLPFGRDSDHVYITGMGEDPLSRTYLFLPGRIPVNVVCPDNAWELGFSYVKGDHQTDWCGLTRRDAQSIKKGLRRRFETILYPGGSVVYRLWSSRMLGVWQDGLRLMFQGEMLFDNPGRFDNTLFERKDLQWIRHAYVIHLMQAWDKFYFDDQDYHFHLDSFVRRGKRLYGGDDVIGLWPTWPTLGLDSRNQFDLFRDLPGGWAQLKKMASDLRKQGTRFFVCYNPWDESTRKEDHLGGIADLIRKTSADGVVLDTRGSSSRELQNAADSVRPGVIMYSEGMAVPHNMSGIVAGRVHNALYYVPMLNLNKFIKPEFAIFRVAELYKEPIRREFATSFFNGYGTELNIFAPGQPSWVEKQYRYLGRTTRILRENTSNFTEGIYTPLIPVSADSIWANQWEYGGKKIYTIYSIIPAGYRGLLFSVYPEKGTHFVDVWNHELLEPQRKGETWMIGAETGSFHRKWLATNNEGAVDAVAQLPRVLKVQRYGDWLHVEASRGKTLKIWAGNPDYGKQPLLLKPGNREIRISEHFGRYEGKLVIQCFNDGNELLDETIVRIPPGEPRRVSSFAPIPAPDKAHAGPPPPGMVRIPAGTFLFRETHGDDFIPYPRQDVDSTFQVPAFYMDRFPVTNRQFKKFLDETHYRPSDTANFLKHWIGGRIPSGKEDFPVVYVSYEDATEYARWAGKKLPTEIEWQYAAQTPAGNEWPWKQDRPVTRREEKITATLTVTALEGIDSARCNLGDGKPYRVGSYPAGANPYGLQDLVGCVWQLTRDIYMNGSYRYIILKGGSYYKPSSSWWYVQGGPRELMYRQYLLRVSQGFERNATVGFRCVK